MSYRGVTYYVQIWIRQRCCACHARYRYANRYAQPEARIEAGLTIEGLVAFFADCDGRGTTPCPCPFCGHYPLGSTGYGMIATAVTLLFFSAIVFGAIAAAAAFDVITATTAAIATAVVAALAGTCILWEAVSNPNRDLERNRRDAERVIDRGQLELLERGVPGGVGLRYPRLWVIRPLGPLLAVGSVVAAFACLQPGYTLTESMLGCVALLTAAFLVQIYVGWRWNSYILEAGVDEILTTVGRGQEIPEAFRDFVTDASKEHRDGPYRR